MTSTSLPPELFSIIIVHIPHDFSDGTQALISAAMSSKNMSAEAQSILFRNPFCPIALSNIPEHTSTLLLGRSESSSSSTATTGFSVLDRHELFLRAVIQAPERLGALVRSYNQSNISYSESEISYPLPPDALESRPGQRAHIFSLTRTALPLMPNLTALNFLSFSGLPASPSILHAHGTQQPQHLEVVQWHIIMPGVNKYDARGAILGRQQTLRHLDAQMWGLRGSHPDSKGRLHHAVNGETSSSSTSSLIDPSLLSKHITSLVGTLEDLAVLAPGRNIVAFEDRYDSGGRRAGHRGDAPHILVSSHFGRDFDREVAETAVSKLRYLRVANYRSYLRLSGAGATGEGSVGLRSLVLMEIVFWSPEEIPTYTHLPHTLELLALLDRRRSLSPLVSKEVALQAFKAAPQLRFVDVGSMDRNCVVSSNRYKRPANLQPSSTSTSLSPTSPGGEEEQTIILPTREFIFDGTWGDAWWRERAASLGWIATHEDMSYRYSF